MRRVGGRRSSLKTVSSVLDATLDVLGIAEKAKEYSFFEHWELIVGKELAKQCYPERLSRHNTLVVRVENASLTQELTFRKEEILTRVHQVPSGTHVQDIRFIVSDPKAIKEKNQAT